MRKNHVLDAWRANQATVGGWISLDSAFAVEIMANAGFDWLCLDMQHGMLDYNDIRQLLPAISTTSTIPLVRVPWNEPYEIMKVLDAGAYGVVIPMVNNRAEAEQAVSACRYPPLGGRSYGPARALIYAGNGYAEQANNEIACIVMIETRESLENLDEIMSTPGVDGIYIGPSDLAFALGLMPGTTEPEHEETIKTILSTAKKHGIAAGIHTGSARQSRKYLDMGFHMVTLGTDRHFMDRMAKMDLEAVRDNAGSCDDSAATGDKLY